MSGYGAPLTEAEVRGLIDEELGSVRSLIRQLQGVMTSNSQPAVSSLAEGPSALGTDLVYTKIDLLLPPGAWLVYAQATMSSQANADSKQLALYNVTTGTDVPMSKSAVQDAPALNINQSFWTLAIVVLGAESVLRMKGLRNGSSQISFGYPSTLNDEQRMFALQLY